MSTHNHHARVSFRRITMGLSLAVSLLSVGCAGQEGELEDLADLGDLEVSEQALEKHYDGATLLRGIFFGRGPVAELLPEVWEKAPSSQEAAAETFRKGMKDLDRSEEAQKGDELIAELIQSQKSKKGDQADEVAEMAVSLLIKKDPGFVKHFERGMYSGDPVIVSGVIEEAGKRFAELVELEALGDLGRYGAEWFVNDNIAINQNAVLNVNVAVNVDTAYNKTQFWSLELDRLSQLRNEMMVAKMTARFAY